MTMMTLDLEQLALKGDNGLEDTVVPDQDDTLSEQGDAIENDVVIEEQEEIVHSELTRKQKLKSLTKLLDKNNYDSTQPQENRSFVCQDATKKVKIVLKISIQKELKTLTLVQEERLRMLKLLWKLSIYFSLKV